MPTVFGPSLAPFAPSPGGHLGGDPPPTVPTSDDSNPNEEDVVTWARNARGVLKRERQEVTTRMVDAIALSQGSTDKIWKGREPWKIGTNINKCFTIPNKWASILTDNEQTVTYASTRQQGQRAASILSAAFLQAYVNNGWQRVIRNCVFDSRVQGKAYLSLRPDIFNKRKNAPRLFVIPGIQVWVDRNATCIDDAEVVLYEYRESYGKVIARFPDVEDHLIRKYSNNWDPSNIDNTEGKMTAPPATLNMPTGATINNPPYVGAPNPPDDAGGTSGILIHEFWTRPHKTVTVKVPMITVSGEPACVPKEIEYDDGTTEPLRRIVTEGGVVYEIPASLVDEMYALQDMGGVRILDEMDAWEVCYESADQLLYPDGRLLIIVDDAVKPEEGDKLNPLGYFPFIEIEAHPTSSNFHGLSDIDLIKGAHEAFIRLLSLIFNNAMLAGNAIWRIPEGSILSNDDITNAPGSIQREDPMTLKFGKREAAPEMPNYVMKLLEFYLQMMDDLAGLTQAALGKTNAKAQQSTDSTLMQQEQSSVDFRDAQRSLKRGIMVLGQHFQEFVERFYTEPELVEIKDELGQKQAVPLIGSHLTETFHVEAKPGSLMSSTPSARLTSAMNLIQAGIGAMDLPEIWKLMQEVGMITSSREIESRITKERANPAERWKVPGADPGQQKKKGSPKKPNSKRAQAGSVQGSG
jgi:hypothetical protein